MLIVCSQSISCVQLFATLSTVACQAPLTVGFFRQEYWSRLPFPNPGDLPNPGSELASLVSSALAGRFFTTVPPVKPSAHQRRLLSPYSGHSALSILSPSYSSSSSPSLKPHHDLAIRSIHYPLMFPLLPHLESRLPSVLLLPLPTTLSSVLHHIAFICIILLELFHKHLLKAQCSH